MKKFNTPPDFASMYYKRLADNAWNENRRLVSGFKWQSILFIIAISLLVLSLVGGRWRYQIKSR